LEAINPWVVQDQGNTSICVGLVMTMLIKVQMPFLVSTMLTRQQEELNVFERSACSYFHPTWKPTLSAMVAKVLQIASWVPVCLLP